MDIYKPLDTVDMVKLGDSGNVHCMTLGFESKGQVDDAISRVMRIANS